MITKPTNGYKHLKVPDIVNTVSLLQVSATLVAILREVRYKEYITEILNVRY
jgi:hypothetical protein